MMRRWLIVVLLVSSASPSLFAQFKISKELMRDSLDGAFDMSDFLITAHGFIPMPFLITEPAFGGFGGGFAPIFIKKRPPMVDTVRSELKVIPTPPDLTGAMAIYTVNGSWAVMAFRSGTWLKAKSKYRVTGGYADMNLNMYGAIQGGQEQEYEFNFKTIPVSGYLMKNFKGTFWSAGIQYNYLRTEVEAIAGDLPDYVQDEEIESTVSMPGIIVELDNRDNIFTADKGLRFHANYSWSNEIFGSDFNYEKLTAYSYGYYPISKKFVGGLRFEMQQVFGDVPFYLLPYIDLRGIPTARYQGNIFSLIEGELRWDFVSRWSIVGFAGSGKAYNDWSDFSESAWNSSGGAGVRYLIARKFKLRMGLDVARGPEQWAYYFVFGSAWRR